MKQFPWSITIESVANGVIVTVGCQKLVYMEDAFGLLTNDINLYLKDYREAEKKLSKRWGLKFGPQPEQPVEERPTSEVSPRRSRATVTCTSGPGRELTADQEDSLVENVKEEKRDRG